MPPEDPAPKLHIDSDWKAEAQAEKERLAAEEEAKEKSGDGARGAGGPRDLPEANFRTLVSMLASQALMGLGTMQDPETRGVVVDLDGARFSIDLLGVLEERTKGNLTDEESSELTQILADLRARYVTITQLVAQQAAAGGAPGVPGVGPGPGTDPTPPSGGVVL